MKTKILLFTISFLSFVTVFSQKKLGATLGTPSVATVCDCKKVEIYTYFYYTSPSKTNVLLRFDLKNKNPKDCKVNFIESISFTSPSGVEISLPVGRLTTRYNTFTQRSFTIPVSQFPANFLPMMLGKEYIVRYKIKVGNTVCDERKTTVKLEDGEPIL